MDTEGVYDNRKAAGERLADLLGQREWPPSTLVIALPRGGVPVAAVIASRLKLALDVLIVRKLGLPQDPEVAMGAIPSGGVTMINDWICASLPNPAEVLNEVITVESEELRRREELYRPDREPLAVEGRTVIVVDDGLATGATMRAAIETLRRRGADRCVVAVPVASWDARDDLAKVADEVLCPIVPKEFIGVGRHYVDFAQTSDAEVRELLAEANLVR
jgi:putative phosphoribosyl transferase